MLQHADPEESSIRRRVLLISSKPSSGDMISEFLGAMGYTWSSTSAWNALAMLERETFDAILIDLVHPSIPVEEAVLKIKEIDAGLAHRLLLIGGSATDTSTAELVGRHNLVHVSQDDLADRLWKALQDVARQREHGLPSRYLQPARMIFDSMKSAPPQGLRSLSTSIRQFVYQHESITIDILLETAQGSGRLLLAGQVLSASSDVAAQAGLPVLLINEARTVARTTTDKFGEFNLEFESAESASLEIRLVERLWVSIPLSTTPKAEEFPP
jgi:DNA-binding NtrC family response regulator